LLSFSDNVIWDSSVSSTLQLILEVFFLYRDVIIIVMFFVRWMLGTWQ